VPAKDETRLDGAKIMSEIPTEQVGVPASRVIYVPDCLPRRRGAAGRVPETSGGLERSLDPEEAERHYLALGNWKNPESVRRAARDFWGASGEAGIRWLVSRLRDEVQVEAIHAASSLLARLGEAAIGPAIEELANDPTSDQALALLNALGALGAAESTPTLEGALAELVLADFLQHDDPDLREAAAEAISLLPLERTVHWLTRRLRDEADARVREAIELELSRHRTGQD
jgi:HEAT repeat protein